MENKKGTSVVASVTPNGTWNSDRGLMYKFNYVLTSGVEITAMHKENVARFAVGSEVEYEITKTTQYGNMGKLSAPKTENAPAPKAATKSYGAKRQSWQESLAITKDACLGAAAEFYSRKGGGTVVEIIQLAGRLVNFVTHGTPAQDFDMWSNVHTNLIHRTSAAKSAVKVGDSPSGCIQFAMEFIKYIDEKVAAPAPAQVQAPVEAPAAPAGDLNYPRPDLSQGQKSLTEDLEDDDLPF